MKNLFIAFAIVLSTTTVFSEESTSVFSESRELSKKYSWMFNVGTSRMADLDGSEVSASGITASGLYTITNRFSAGGAFSHYDYKTFSSNFQMISAVGEFEVIQADLYAGSKLFSSLTTGLNYEINDFAGSRTSLNYGVALGVQFNSQIGVRLDIKSGRNITTASGFSLVGYY